MKDKEKQIEEMARNIRVGLEDGTYRYFDTRTKDRILTGYRFNDTAEILYEQGYRKLPKDSMVLSKEEQDKLYSKGFNDGKEFAEKFYKPLVRAETRKETAEKFYKKVKKLLKKVDVIVDGDEGLVGYEETAVVKGLTELAKQFDVEIKE